MGYIKAEEILPVEVIELIQQYIDGVNIYIPKKKNNRQKWGNNTTYRTELRNRNREIYNKYLSGIAVEKLAKSYYLSPKSIQRIIMEEKDKI